MVRGRACAVGLLLLALMACLGEGEEIERRGESNAADLQGLPNVIMIGTQKSGSSHFFKQLRKHSHSHVLTPQPRLHYFNKMWKDVPPGLRLEAYRGMWHEGCATMGEDVPCARFEKTPAYLFEPEVPYRMAELYGEAKALPGLRLMATLRDPLTRALSQVQMGLRRGNAGGKKHTESEVIKLSASELRAVFRRTVACYKGGEEELWSGGKLQCSRQGDQVAARRRFENCYRTQEAAAAAGGRGGGGEGKEGAHRMLRGEEAAAAAGGGAGEGAPGATELRLTDDWAWTILHRGIYADQLARYLCAGFDPSQISVVPYTMLLHLPASQYGPLVHTVASDGRMPRYTPSLPFGPDHTPPRAKREGIPPDLRHELVDFFEPHNKRLVELLAWASKRGMHMPLGYLDTEGF